jgi:hypothetical protein
MSDSEEITDPFVKCDHCNIIINMDKHGYYILERENNNSVEEVWCQDCFYSPEYTKKKEEGWICSDDEQDEK